MDQKTPALQIYNGGIIFVSYVIAVVGAMTTLELLQRRTHIRGKYNWFLLFAAAASMGGVGIWSMHFIGNNSLTIILENGDEHQLSYSAGFTFTSLIVAILTMFLAFTFVGITEEARVSRIIPSGVVAGLGIVSMHYLGQVAIDFFIMKNKLSFVIGASVIAVCAATAALFIFFKLREQWENQWYKRLGCAMLMGIAVCGMHYTALLGTMYYPGDSNDGPPTPLIATPALIGIISSIVIVACILLFFIVAKSKLENNRLPFQKKANKRLILDTIFFDTNGRILVKVDGIVPMKEVLDKLPENDQHGAFSTNHPLFMKLFETSIKWSATDDEHHNNSGEYMNTNINNLYGSMNNAFINAANELVNDLRLTQLSDLGFLFDSVLSTNVIVKKKSLFSHDSKSIKKTITRRTSSTGSWLLSNKSAKESTDELHTARKFDHNKRSVSHDNSVTVIDIFNDTGNSDSTSVNNGLSIRDSDSEDKHIFLVKKVDSNKDLVNLLSIGFRFAEPVFISKTMGEKLNVPSEYMLNYFRDMLQMTETVTNIYSPIKPPGYSLYSPTAYKHFIEKNNNEVRSGVFIGLFVIIEDTPNQVPYIIVDKNKRNTFPLVQLSLDNGDTKDSQIKLAELTREQKNIIMSLNGQSLTSISSINSTNTPHTDDSSTNVHFQDSGYFFDNDKREQSPVNSKNLAQQFMKALERSAKELISKSSYGKPLATSAKLYGDVIDVPAFSLRSGPCQLIVFRAHITTPGTRFAINQTLTESIKCIPFPLYKSFAYYSTNFAVEKYKLEQNKYKVPSSYLTQQRLYQSTATRNKDLNIKSQDKDNILEEESHEMDENIPQSLSTYSSSSKAQPTQFSSLPPPPRAKRSKFALPTGIASLDISSINKDIIPSIMKGTKSIPLSPVSPSNPSELPIILNILPVNGRFWWLDSIYDETHNNM